MKVGVFPIRNHYYEPKFDYGYPKPLETERTLPGIDWNVPGQMDLLSRFNFAHELVDIPLHKPSGISFYMNNAAFIAGDAEYWYQLIRHLKPKRIFEVGSGNSTLMAIRAIQKNRECDPMYNCKLVCIEPYENPWLEDLDVKIVRKRIEDIELSFFAELEENDILFVDSSHVIRPGGDVLFEFLELFPRLKKGVIVHLHDIFSAKRLPETMGRE